jgi:hypothetical protein
VGVSKDSNVTALSKSHSITNDIVSPMLLRYGPGLVMSFKYQSNFDVSFSAIILVGFIRTITAPSPLFILPYDFAFFFPI